MRSYSAPRFLWSPASFCRRMASPLTWARLTIAACRFFLRSRMPCSVILIGSSRWSIAAWAFDSATLNILRKIPGIVVLLRSLSLQVAEQLGPRYRFR